MPMYRYVKSSAVKRRQRKSIVVSFALMFFGVGILLWTVWPIMFFQFFSLPGLVNVVSPITEAGGKEENDINVDYTNANVWFPNKPQKRVVTPVNTYKLSIPKLGINKAMVIIAGDDLGKSLIHYGGTGLPGEYGTTVIFGHSTLPQFFKGERDYKAIFSTIPTMKIGDEIFLEYDGITYRYLVYDMKVTQPNDLSSLEQRFDDSYLTLITCVPPGTYWLRLNVKARLVRPL